MANLKIIKGDTRNNLNIIGAMNFKSLESPGLMKSHKFNQIFVFYNFVFHLSTCVEYFRENLSYLGQFFMKSCSFVHTANISFA